MLLPPIDIVLLCALFFVSTVQHSFYLYLSAYGLWWELRWPYILSTVANLAMNLLFCHLWNTSGIILATLLAQLFFGLIWQSTILFKKCFNKSAAIFYKKQMIYFGIGFVICVIDFLICGSINLPGIIGLLIKLILCLVVSLLLLISVFWKTAVFKQCKLILLRSIRK